jgi:hypothetical protein
VIPSELKYLGDLVDSKEEMSLVFSTGSKFIRTSATALWGSSVSVASTRRFSEAFGEREKGYENVDVRKHDEELLKRLRDSEAARDKAEARAKVYHIAIVATLIYLYRPSNFLLRLQRKPLRRHLRPPKLESQPQKLLHFLQIKSW